MQHTCLEVWNFLEDQSLVFRRNWTELLELLGFDTAQKIGLAISGIDIENLSQNHKT